MESKKIQLSEGWGVSPNDLSPVGRIGGTTLYSSDELKKRVATILLTKSKVFSPIQTTLVELFKKDIIIPCFASKSFLRFMISKIMTNQTINGIYGMFDTNENKVYLFLDNNVSTFLNRVSIDDLNTVLIHELIHYAAYNKISMFLSISKSIILKYYQTFYNSLNFSTISNNFLNDYIKWLVVNIELKTVYRKSLLIEYEQLLNKHMPDSSQETNNIVHAIFSYLTNFNAFENYAHHDSKERYIVVNLYKGYSAINVSNPQTFPIQELLYPSEIMAIYCQEKQNTIAWKIIKGI